MPREHSKLGAHAPGGQAAHDNDLEPEHAPHAARQVSLAGLRREAAALDPTTQHRKADTADLHGQQSAIVLVAKHMESRAATIDQLCQSRTNTEAGASPAIQAIMACIAEMDAEVSALNSRMGDIKDASSGMSTGADQLTAEIGQLKSGIYVFEAALGRAKWFAREHGEPITATTASIDKSIDEMLRKVTREGVELSKGRHAVDHRSEPALFAEAMTDNLGAAHEAAQAMRAEMTTGTEAVLGDDLKKLTRHLKEIENLLGQVTAKSARSYQPRVRTLLAEVHALEKESTPRNLAGMFRNTHLVETVAAIQAKIGH